jgi:LysM repeat protein
MNRFYLLIASLALFSTYGEANPEGTTESAEAPKSAKIKSSKLVDYKVKRGDTLFSIAKKHGTTLRKIVMINGLNPKSPLLLGAVLKVPTNTVVYAKNTVEVPAPVPAVQKPPKVQTPKPAPAPAAKTVSTPKKKKSAPVAAKPKASRTKALVHTVKKGDTLSNIAYRYKVSVAALKKANRLKSNNIMLGQKLTIPKKGKTKAAPKKKAKHASTLRTHTIEKGDTLFKIARDNHITIDALKQHNHISSDRALKLGQVLTLPEPAPKEDNPTRTLAQADTTSQEKPLTIASVLESTGTTHTIKKGDTLYKIAKANGTTIKALKEANEISSTKRLKLGQVLVIPGATAAQKQPTVLASADTTPKKSNKSEEKKGATLASAKEGTKSTKKTAVASAKKPTEVQHTVKKGDTLYKIAKANNTTIKALKKANKIKSTRSLKLGQILVIPGAVATQEPAIKLASAEKTKKTLEKNKKGEEQKETKLAKKEAEQKKIKLAEAQKKKEKAKLAAAKAEKEKKAKLAKAEAEKKKKLKLAAAKKAKQEKAKKEASRQSKKSFLATLIPSGDRSPLKLSAAKKQLGKRYVWGAQGPYCFDCSGFTSYVCKKSGVKLPRRSIEQSKVGKRVSRKELKPGDLVFFDTSRRRRGYVNHVGIYLGNNKFIHASSAKRRVVIASLDKPFYKSRFKWGRRIKK